MHAQDPHYRAVIDDAFREADVFARDAGAETLVGKLTGTMAVLPRSSK